MKAIALLIVLATLAIGTYLGKMKSSETASNAVIEDSVGSQMAAPRQVQDNTTNHHSDIPL